MTWLFLLLAAQDVPTLEWKWTKGKSVRDDLVRNCVATSGAERAETLASSGVTLKVIGVDGKGTAEVEATVDRIYYCATIEGRRFEFESDWEDAAAGPEHIRFMANFLGKTRTYRVALFLFHVLPIYPLDGG